MMRDDDGTGGGGGSVAAGRGRGGLRLRMAFVLDVAGYGARALPVQEEVQRRLRQLAETALGECGLKLDPEIVDHQWTGDGINAVLPADMDPTVVLPRLIRSLAAALDADNAKSADRIRLRMAVSAGLIERSVAGFSGQLILDISRLVDSSALRDALAGAPAADLAVAISDCVYAMVVRPGYPGIPGRQFSRANAVAKEFSAAAWVWLSSRQWTDPPYLALTAADPEEVGGYRICGWLGRSAAGQVYLGAADGGAGGSWAAVKVFDPALAADADVRRRLAAGALAASVLADPQLAPVIAADPEAARPWAASALVRGPSLADAAAQTGPLPPATVGWTALGLARALATVHRAGLTHGAVTPGNVLLGGQGPVLADFGVNRAALAHGPGGAAEDVFLLGQTLCFAATGRPAGADGPPGAAGDPDLAGCPAELTPIVAACLAADPGARPSADRLVDWLATVAGPQPRSWSWLPGPVAARLRDYRELPPPRPASWPRFRRPR